MELVRNYKFKEGTHYLEYDRGQIPSVSIYEVIKNISQDLTSMRQECTFHKLIILANFGDYEFIEGKMFTPLQAYTFKKGTSYFYELTEEETLLFLSEGM